MAAWIEVRQLGKDLKVSDHDLIELLARHLLEGTGIGHVTLSQGSQLSYEMGVTKMY